MQITLSPHRGLPGQPETSLHVAGDVLTIDGTPYDLGAVPEAGEGEWPDSPITGAIRRIDGVIHATVRVSRGDDWEPHQPSDPADWVISKAEGDVTIPALRKPEPEAEEWD